MKYARLLFALALLYCLRDCSCNNWDPCLNPNNQNLIVPFRETFSTYGSFFTPYSEAINITDTTNCYVFQLFQLTENQYRTTDYPGYSFISLYGYLTNTCTGGSTFTLSASFYVAGSSLMDVSSPSAESVTISAAQLEGVLYNETFSASANVSLGVSTFTSNRTDPTYESQRDEFVTNDDSPCTIRIRSNNVERTFLYSHTFAINIRLYSGQLLYFTYPAGIRSRIGVSDYKYYNQQCNCTQSLTGSGAAVNPQTGLRTDPSSATKYRFTPPTIAGVPAAPCQ